MKNLKEYTEFNESVKINEDTKTNIGEFEGRYLKVRVNHTDYSDPDISLVDFVIDRNWDGASNHNVFDSSKTSEEAKLLAQEFYKDLAKLAETFDKSIDKLRKKYK